MKYKYFIYLLAAFVAFMVLCNPAHLYFLSDDFDSMYSSLKWHNVAHSYRPMSDLFLMVDHKLWSDNAVAYHITNIALHFCSTAMLFAVADKMFGLHYEKSTAAKYAFLTSVVFLFYAYHSEPIFWIVGRGSLLATLFTLCSLYFFFQKQKNAAYYLLSLFTFLLALFSYESTWAFPVIVIWLTFFYDKKTTLKTNILYCAGYWVVFAGYLAMRLRLTQTVVGSPYGTKAIIKYDPFSLGKNFSALFSRSFIPPLHSSGIYVICFIVLMIALAVILLKTKSKWNTVFYITIPAFIIALLPTISLGIDTHDTESERFLYLPSLFLCIAVVQLLVWLCGRRLLLFFYTIIAANIYLLFVSYNTFVKASEITQQTVQTLKTLDNIDTLYCSDVPTQYEGAFIFRNGLINAVKYYKPSVKQVVILSEIEIFNPFKKSYPVTFLSAEKATVQNSKFALQKSAALLQWKAENLEVFK